jgi:cellulose synthase/poly-beta-1,6-N-acetylglucosamine synthase-like glycosyltransferase
MPSEPAIAVSRSTIELASAPGALPPDTLPLGTAVARLAPRSSAWRPKPHFYLAVLTLWAMAVAWFHPQLATLPALGKTVWSKGALWFFVLFIDIAWGYAAYNVGVIVFGAWYARRQRRTPRQEAAVTEYPAVALLYTTCNDFVERSVRSCIEQDYPEHRVYILDDSTDPECRGRIDRFAAAHSGRVRVIRRSDRRAYKAGNLNHALATVAREPLFALVDADEILPPHFLRALVPRLLAQPDCGFVQATHRCNPHTTSSLARDVGPGVDSHWRWYHPLRNDYGFVMLLGHGALLKRQAWLDAGGFPELVSEDLAFALRAREAGWRGRFAEDVVCYEEFPEDVRAFRVRHMKWTRGTCEFLLRETGGLLRSRRITWVEKLDILLPTLNLPLSFLFFLFVLDANLVLTSLYGNIATMTWVIGGRPWLVPVLRLNPAFEVLDRADLYVVTLIALVSPVLCFVIDMARQPRRLWTFLAQSTALYGALGPLSSIGVILFAFTRRAVFHVTADRARRLMRQRGMASRLRTALVEFARRSHPDDPLVQGIELVCGVLLVSLACVTVQLPFLGLALGYLMLPVLHNVRWDCRPVRAVIHLPLILIIVGVVLGSLSLMGIQTVFFGYGFHF